LNKLQTDVEDDESITFGQNRVQVNRIKLQHMDEGKQVTLKGFIFIARQEGGESVNCKNQTDIKEGVSTHDIHISGWWKTQMKQTSAIASWSKCRLIIVRLIGRLEMYLSSQRFLNRW
jgi:hypothetical protein